MKKGQYWILIILLIILILAFGIFFAWYIRNEIINKTDDSKINGNIQQEEKYANETWQDEYIYWLQEKEEGKDLLIMNADGSGIENVVEEKETWKGVGNIIINSNNTYYTYVCDDILNSLCIFDIENNKLNKLDFSGKISDIAWNNEGNKIVFIGKNMTDGPTSAIIWMNADGSEENKLDISNGPQGLVSQPAFSPDGSKILFTLTKDDGDQGIYVADLKNNSVEVLADSTDKESNASYSYDGKKIVFQVENGKAQIWAMDANSDNQTQLTKAGNNWDPSFSLDGNRVIFISDRDNEGIWDIYSMYYDGQDQTRLTDNLYNDIYPHWSSYKVTIKKEAVAVDPANILDGFIIAKISGSSEEIKNLVHPDHQDNMDLTSSYQNLYLNNIKGYNILSEEDISAEKKYYKVELQYKDESLNNEVLIYSLEKYGDQWLLSDVRLDEDTEEVEEETNTESMVTTGNFSNDINELENIQTAVDDGNDTWRLDPLEVAKQEGEEYGLDQNNDSFTLISQVEVGDYSGGGEATVEVSHSGTSYIIQLSQPQKQGNEGIWVITSIVNK